MTDRAHDLPVTKQAEVLRISRGSVYYRPRPVPEVELAIMRRLDRLHLEFPFAGSRMLRGLLAAEGCKIGPSSCVRCDARKCKEALPFPMIANGMVRPCSRPARKRSWQGAPKTTNPYLKNCRSLRF